MGWQVWTVVPGTGFEVARCSGCSRLPLGVSSTGAGGWVERASRRRWRRGSAGGRLVMRVATVDHQIVRAVLAGSRVAAVSGLPRGRCFPRRCASGTAGTSSAGVLSPSGLDGITGLRTGALPGPPRQVVRDGAGALSSLGRARRAGASHAGSCPWPGSTIAWAISCRSVSRMAVEGGRRRVLRWSSRVYRRMSVWGSGGLEVERQRGGR